ncbi:TfoX/Sxy family protein [Deefgea tanakiae]|uniref:TfoX/Sxy family protein n=1 Tax=Deefgea tanakiae TaxID=2865840 RepID=A0ABX8Z7R0_9NEIS|nr:TfoX/Sxy family protein [Deefgea tanakiae]QZA77190.1 TfoX/Sxy family protein [Deefgea tanakiae]
MARRSEYVDYLLDELAPLGKLRAKAMFGGFGLYCDELFFALVAEDMVYFKVDDVNRPRFIAEHLAPFCFAMKDGRSQTMSYYPLPESALESQAELLDWAKEGVAAALRAKRPTRR